MSLQSLPHTLDLKELFIDVKLTAIGESSNRAIDFTGRKSFSVGFMREGKGFGITDINIETKTSLQPIVEITFKDLYGSLSFGRIKNKSVQNSEIDYGILFDWPPPKFEFTFKGYLGKPVTWIMNIKKTTTSFNSSDGSYTIKVTFVPNQWGFFADMPFLYLLAVKKLKEDINGTTSSLPVPIQNASADKVVTIFDLIKLGKRVESKNKEVTKEFDKLRKQLSVLKANAIDGLINRDFKFGDIIDGKVSGRAPIRGLNIEGQDKLPDFQPITITPTVAYNGFTDTKLQEALKELKSDAQKTLIEHRKLIALIGNPKSVVQGENIIGAAPQLITAEALNVAVQAGLKKIDDNIKLIDVETKRRFFETTKDQLGALTISDIFSRIAGDGAFMLGSILDAGIKGHNDNKDIRSSAKPTGKDLIGKYYPLQGDDSGEQKPARNPNVGIDNPGAEMDFVRRFIVALSEGIASNRVDENENDLSSENQLSQRINNLEILSDNPYVGANAQKIIENILIRSGIAGYVTRSFDPNQPGDYNVSKIKAAIDNDFISDLKDLATKELKNIPDSVLTNLSSDDTQNLLRFCSFINKLLHVDGDKFLNENGDLIDIPENLNGISGSIKSYLVTLKTEKNAQGVETKTSVTVGDFFSKFIGANSLFYDSKSTKDENSKIPFFSNTIDFQTFQTNYLYHNNLLWVIPEGNNNSFFSNDTANVYTHLVFTNPNDISRIDQAKNNDTDTEFEGDENKEKDGGFGGDPLGIVRITNGESTKKKNSKEYIRLGYINKRIGEDGSAKLAIDYSKLNSLNSIPTKKVNGVVSIDRNVANIYIKQQINKDNVGNGIDYMVYSQVDTESDNDLTWGLFKTGDNRARNQRVFLSQICSDIEKRLNQLEDEKNNVLSQVLGKASSHEDSLYQQMHHIFHQWKVLSLDENGNERPAPLSIALDTEYSTTVTVGPDNKITEVSDIGKQKSTRTLSAGFKYDFPMERINPPPVLTNVAHSIINIEPLYKPNANTTLLNVLQQICTKNNFLFIPIPGNGEYTNIVDIFKPSNVKAKIGNLFHVLFTPTPESRNQLNDGTPISLKLPEDSTLDAFEIIFGSPDNTIVRSIDVNTEDNKPTAESILSLQKIVDKENTNKAPTTDCSMLSVMEGRSYKMNCEVIGNAQISPMQFFIVKNAPVFGGLYQIMSSSHSISPNNMSTKFEGVKMRFGGGNFKGIAPITLESLESLGASSSMQQPLVSTTSSPSSLIPESIYGHSGEISQSFIDKVKNVRFANANDINTFFKKTTGLEFSDWFNKNMSSNQVFSNKKINSANFNLFWNNAIPIIWDRYNGQINIIEFLAINTIIINETGGQFIAKIPEGVNSVNKPTNPGIAYAFNSISGIKKSYNTLSTVQNKTAFELFKDAQYKDAHQNLPFGDINSGLRDTTDSKWASNQFPVGLFSKNLVKAVDPHTPSFITEADFFKFRGRGYIQVTGRVIYKSIIDYVLGYKGTNLKIKQYKSKWSIAPFNKNSDIIATRSTNVDWDDLFSNTDLIISIRSIREHASNVVLGNGSYQYFLNIEIDRTKLLSEIVNVAKKIAGGGAVDYHELYRNRILLQTDTIDKS